MNTHTEPSTWTPTAERLSSRVTLPCTRSWGPGWGIDGYIHLSRKADNQTFVDKRPADGTACHPLPDQQVVGGECGVLFGMIFWQTSTLSPTLTLVLDSGPNSNPNPDLDPKCRYIVPNGRACAIRGSSSLQAPRACSSQIAGRRRLRDRRKHFSSPCRLSKVSWEW